MDSSQVHAPADALIVPDAQLLFHGDFKRAGNDLVLSRDHHDFVLHDYFKGEKRAAIASPDGAHLTADIIKALVGEVHVSQAGNAQLASQVIGHVTKLQGSATAVRNGVSIILNTGDNVEKGDVVESGSNSTLGLTFIDGTVFGLSSNARMVLNEMVYDPNGSNNSSLMSLVAGTISFVAGETAKHGDMKVDTPVATMGIRGTACLVEIDFTVPGTNQSPTQLGQPAPSASFQVLVEPDGTTGSYILFDKTTLQPIAIVNQAGQQLNINNGVISQTTTPLSPEIQKLITDVFQQKFSDNTNSNTKTTTAQTDSIIPTSNGFIIKLADGSTATAIVGNTGNGSLDPNVAPPSNPFNHLSGFLQLESLGLSGLAQVLFQTAELAGQTNDTFDFAHVGGTFHFADINVGDRPSVTADFSSVTYTNAIGAFTINAGQTSAPGLSALQFKDIAATAIKLFLVPSPGNANNGDVTWVYSVRDNAFDFLAAGEKLTFTYHVVLNNNFAAAPEAQGLEITITVTGTNDKPQITTGTPEIDFEAGTKTSGGNLPTNNPTSGSLAFTDVDLTDKHTVSVALTGAVMSNGGTIPPLPSQLFNDPTTLTVSIETDSTGTGNGVIHWQLADLPVYVADFIPVGQTVTLTYTVTLTDSSGDLTTGSTTQTITVVITGTNDAAEVWIHTTTDHNDNLWTTGQNWETGLAPSSTDDAIIITDQLHPNTPAYPALINVTTAVAHSVTMNDFAAQSTDPAHQAPELDVASGAKLTIGADLSLGADSKLVNAGTVIVGGKLELLDAVDPQSHLVSLNEGSVDNSGMLNLGQGGDIEGKATVTNTGTIDLKGGTLNVLVDVANAKAGSAGQITVEQGATLALGSDANNPGVSGGITGGTITVKGTLTLDQAIITDAAINNNSIGEIDLNGLGVLTGGTLDNAGKLKVSGTGNALHGETVTANNMIEVLVGAILTLDLSSTIANGGGLLAVDDGGKLVLDAATIHNGIINNGTASGTLGQFGAIEIKGSSKFDQGATLNNGAVTIESATLTLDNVIVNGTTFTEQFSGSLIQVDGGDSLTLGGGATIQGGIGVTGAIGNGGTIEIAGPATLSNDTLTNAIGGIVQVDGGVTLTLKGTEITGGIINDFSGAGNGTIDVTGNSEIDGNATLNKGLVTVESATLTLDDVTVNGTTITEEVSGSLIQVDSGHKLTLGGGATIQGGAGVNGKISNGGTIEVAGTATLLNDTLTNTGTVQVDGGVKLTLSGTEITGGTINDFSGAGNGTIDVTGNSVIDGNATLNGGFVTVENATLTLNDVTVSGTTITEMVSGSVVQIDNNHTLHLDNSTILHGTLNVEGTLDSTGDSFITDVTIDNTANIHVSGGTLTIDPAPFANSGTILVTDGGTLVLDGETVDNSPDGTIQIDTAPNLVSTLDLNNSSIDGGIITISGVLDSTGTSSINGATINYGGIIDVLSGTLTIDATSILNNTGTGSFEVDGGKLIIDAALSGSLEIKGASTLELGAAENLYSHVTVTFDAGSTGTLMLDHAEAFQQVGAGLTVAGLDDNTLDLLNVQYGSGLTAVYSGDAFGGMLSLFQNGYDVSDIKLTGDYLGVRWILSDDGLAGHGTTISEAPGVIVGLNQQGNAVEDEQLTVSITDGGATVSAAHYDWQVSTDGKTWQEANGANGQSAYTPVEGDEGQFLQVVLTYTDATGHVETSTVSAGTVQESPTENASILLSGLTNGNAVEDQKITAVINEPDAPSSGITYVWTVDGSTVKTGVDGLGNTYTPTENDEGKTISVSVSFTDTHGFSEQGTQSGGTVQESPTENASILLSGLTNGNAVENQQITAVVTEADAPSSGITYTWRVNGSIVKTGVDALGNTYTPTEADEGKTIKVSVSFADTHGFHEEGTQSGGTVQEKAGGDLVAILDSMIAQDDVTMHVTKVTDGGVTVTQGVSYKWQTSIDGGLTWTTVGTNSSFTPSDAQEGKLMQLVVSYTEATGAESVTYGLGVPADLTATLDSTTAQQGLPIHVTGVSDGGDPVSSGVSYAWQVSSDGHSWTTVGIGSAYAPKAADAGEQLQLVVSYTEPGEHESITKSLGVVAAAKEWTTNSTDTWETSAKWALPGAPGSADNAVVDATGSQNFTVKVDQATSAHSLVVNSSHGTVEITGGGSLTLGGNLTIDAGNLLIDSGGLLKQIAASSTIVGAFTNNGTIEVGAGDALEVASSSISSHGTFKIDAGASLQIDHAESLNVVFAGSGTLVLEDPAHFSGKISDSTGSMTTGDVLDLIGFDTSAHVSYSGNASGGTVTITESGHTSVHLQVGANSTHWTNPVSDGHGGILIHDPPQPDSSPATGQTWARDGFTFKPDMGQDEGANQHPWTDLNHGFPSHAPNVADLFALVSEAGQGDGVGPVDPANLAALHHPKMPLIGTQGDFHFA